MRLLFALAQTDYTRAPPSIVTCIEKAVVWNNMIFVDVGDRAVPLYECYRQNDRQEKGGNLGRRLAERDLGARPPEDETARLFIGSSGSFNYGHWLVDDFPRYKAIPEMERRLGGVTLVLSSFHNAIDAVRRDATRLVSQRGEPIAVEFIDPEIPRRFDRLYYATPVTYHPFVKNGHAIDFVREIGRTRRRASSTPKRLFINRHAPWPRRIINIGQILPVLQGFGFTEVVPERHSLEDQIDLFANAEAIVGIMGAGMANIVFAPEQIPVQFFAPDGWQEPFFWDLAAATGHDYRVVFGPGHDDGHHLYQQSFDLPPGLVVREIAKLVSAP